MGDEFEFLAYFTLSFKSVTVNTSKTQLKKITGGFTNSNSINAFLIGQIGKNSLIKNNPVMLSHILEFAYEQIQMAQFFAAGRGVILECEDNPKLISYYERHGFKYVETIGNDDLKTMFIIPEFRE